MSIFPPTIFLMSILIVYTDLLILKKIICYMTLIYEILDLFSHFHRLSEEFQYISDKGNLDNDISETFTSPAERTSESPILIKSE